MHTHDHVWPILRRERFFRPRTVEHQTCVKRIESMATWNRDCTARARGCNKHGVSGLLSYIMRNRQNTRRKKGELAAIGEPSAACSRGPRFWHECTAYLTEDRRRRSPDRVDEPLVELTRGSWGQDSQPARRVPEQTGASRKDSYARDRRHFQPCRRKFV